MRELLKPNVERYEQAVKNLAPSGYTGCVILSECRVCGYLEWSCTRTNEPAGYRVEIMDRVCQRCSQAHARAPEVFEWVMNVAGMILRESKAADGDSDV